MRWTKPSHSFVDRHSLPAVKDEADNTELQIWTQSHDRRVLPSRIRMHENREHHKPPGIGNSGLARRVSSSTYIRELPSAWSACPQSLAGFLARRADMHDALGISGAFSMKI